MITASDIAYLRKIKSGLSAVTDANKDALKDSLLPHMDILKEIKEGNEGVKFSGLNSMESNQALRLMSTNLVIYKDGNNMYIPLGIKKSQNIEIVPEMYKDEHFRDVMEYAPKSKDFMIDNIKEKIKNSDEIKRSLKAEGWSMTKIFKIPSMKEQSEILKNFGIYDLENILENFHIKKQSTYRLKKLELENSWVSDNITKNIQRQYEELKIMLMSELSASEVLSSSKRILDEVESVLNNNPLDEVMKFDKRVVDFFNIGSKEILIPREEIGDLNFIPSYHERIISKANAIKIVKNNNLEGRYPIAEKDTISVFLPSSNIEQLKFGLMDYLTYQVNMKNEYKMMMQENEKTIAPTTSVRGY